MVAVLDSGDVGRVLVAEAVDYTVHIVAVVVAFALALLPCFLLLVVF